MSGKVFDHSDDEIIIVTPDPEAKIEKIAPVVAKMTKELGMDAEIHFPTFTLNVPQAATARDILEAYYAVKVEYLSDLRPGFKPPDRGPKFN
jgi:hypothetical protein